MNNFLKKIKLRDTITFELNCSKSDFIEKFKTNVEYSDLGYTPFEAFEVFSSSRFEYKGTINSQGFKIKKKRKLFDGQQTFAIARGTFVENIDRLIITTEINSFKKRMLLYVGLIFCCYFILIIGFTYGAHSGSTYLLSHSYYSMVP